MNDHTNRPYYRLVPACAERGIPRTTAFELSRTGLIESFLIGRRRFCYLDSLDSLPQRIAAMEAGEVAA